LVFEAGLGNIVVLGEDAGEAQVGAREFGPDGFDAGLARMRRRGGQAAEGFRL